MTGGLPGAPSPVTGGQPAPLRRGDRVRLVVSRARHIDDLLEDLKAACDAV